MSRHPLPASHLSLQEIRNPLEPLLIRLIKGYVDDADLTRRLRTLYLILDRWKRGAERRCSMLDTCVVLLKHPAFYVARFFCMRTSSGSFRTSTGGLGLKHCSPLPPLLSDCSGGLSADEFCLAMKKLGEDIHVSRCKLFYA